jgi:hypothetical protein
MLNHMSQIVLPSKQEEVELFVERAKKIYRDVLATKLESACIGKIVAIDPETGDYFLGEREVEAAEQARAAGNMSPLFFLRVGSTHTYRWPTPRR